MEPCDTIPEIVSVELPCIRCAKPMALDRLYYAIDQICSVAYKCLYCGYEETRPQTGVALSDLNKVIGRVHLQ